jgi:hypothetical protein
VGNSVGISVVGASVGSKDGPVGRSDGARVLG